MSLIGSSGMKLSLLAALTAAAYANSIDGTFVFDDTAITQNPHIQTLSLSGILSGEALREATRALPQTTLSGRPLVTLTFAVNYAISGGAVWSYHAANILIHLGAGWTLFGLMWRTLVRMGRPAGEARMLAFVAAAIWLVHPLQTQSVTYIVQRAESQMGLFYLLTVYGVARGLVSRRRGIWFAAAVVFSAAGMACKESMATAPLAAMLYCWIFGRPMRQVEASVAGVAGGTALPRGGRAQRWLLFAGLAGTWAVLALVAGDDARSESAGFKLAHVRPWTYLLTQCEVIWHYLRLAAWPHGLAIDYDWPIVRSLSEVWPAALALLVLLIATAIGAGRRRPWSFPAAWVFLTLGPTSSVIPISDAAFEHRMYLPLAGLAAMVVCVAEFVLSRIGRVDGVTRRWVSATIVALTLCLLGWRTIVRNSDYASPVSIWQATVKARPDNARARYNLGRELSVAGRNADAIEHYRRALALAPTHADAYIGLGIALEAQGQYEAAAQHYVWAIELRPQNARAYYNLGLAMEAMGRLAEARTALVQALKWNPDLSGAREALNRVDRAMANGGSPAG